MYQLNTVYILYLVPNYLFKTLQANHVTFRWFLQLNEHMKKFSACYQTSLTRFTAEPELLSTRCCRRGGGSMEG